MNAVIFFGLVLVVLCIGPSWGDQLKGYGEDQRRIIKIIEDRDKNDPEIRPPGINVTGPLIVTSNVFLRSISHIDDIKQEYSAQITFRSTWTDQRLAFPSDVHLKSFNLEDASKIWTPDVFFSNERDGRFHNILKPNQLIRIYRGGEILYSILISLRLSCPMDFRRYPHDSQICSLIMPSYGHTSEDLLLKWKESSPVQIRGNLQLQNFKLTNHNTGYCSSKTLTGEYSCLKAEFRFERTFNTFLIRVYIPSIMLILVSYLHLWLSISAITSRVMIAMGALLVMSAGVVDLNHSSPTTSYTKAIDVWTGVCLTFLFFSLIEIAVVQYLARRHSANGKESGDVTGDGTPLQKKLAGKRFFSFLSNQLFSERIDVITRVAYPSLFLLFNVIYWASYLPQESVEIN